MRFEGGGGRDDSDGRGSVSVRGVVERAREWTGVRGSRAVWVSPPVSPCPHLQRGGDAFCPDSRGREEVTVGPFPLNDLYITKHRLRGGWYHYAGFVGLKSSSLVPS